MKFIIILAVFSAVVTGALYISSPAGEGGLLDRGPKIHIVKKYGLRCAYVHISTGGGLSCDWDNYIKDMPGKFK